MIARGDLFPWRRLGTLYYVQWNCKWDRMGNYLLVLLALTREINHELEKFAKSLSNRFATSSRHDTPGPLAF